MLSLRKKDQVGRPRQKIRLPTLWFENFLQTKN